MKIKSLHLGIVILVVIFGGIALTSALGYWSTTTTKTPATYKDGEFAGKFNPADIRGSYTFGDIEKNFKIPLEDLGKAFHLKNPSTYSNFQCKELEATYASLSAEGKELGTGSVRLFVALYNGLPIEIEEGTYLLTPAVEILKTKAKTALSAEDLNYINTHQIDPNTIVSSTGTTENKDTEEEKIKGITTFKEVLDWGVEKAAIEKMIGGSLSSTTIAIKDYCNDKGIEFVTIKDALQKLVDEKNK